MIKFEKKQKISTKMMPANYYVKILIIENSLKNYYNLN
jgi:hypothetical protein